MNSEKSEQADWSEDGGIAAVLKASTETNLKFACLVRFINAGHILRKEILDAVLYLVSYHAAVFCCETSKRSAEETGNKLAPVP